MMAGLQPRWAVVIEGRHGPPPGLTKRNTARREEHAGQRYASSSRKSLRTTVVATVTARKPASRLPRQPPGESLTTLTNKERAYDL